MHVLRVLRLGDGGADRESKKPFLEEICRAGRHDLQPFGTETLKCEEGSAHVLDLRESVRNVRDGGRVKVGNAWTLPAAVEYRGDDVLDRIDIGWALGEEEVRDELQ